MLAPLKALFDVQSRPSWRRITVCLGLLVFACAMFALTEKMPANIWAYFCGGLAAVYIGGDTLEKVARVAEAIFRR